MNREELINLIMRRIDGSITPEGNRDLEKELTRNPQARTLFREMMDLETGLRTWAAETGDAVATNPVTEKRDTARRRRSGPKHTAIALTAAVVTLGLTILFFWRDAGDPGGMPESHSPARLGAIFQQEDCVWKIRDAALAGRHLAVGRLDLISGTAKLRFDSGTDLIMEGPCTLEVLGRAAARLDQGDLVVKVTELSDGFTLKTPEATLLDEGTEYAVALDPEATEVHVFDGAVIWQSAASEATERIEQGEARRYARSGTARGRRIPFGGRKFRRDLETRLRENAGPDLVAYDGFENHSGAGCAGDAADSAGRRAGSRSPGKAASSVVSSRRPGTKSSAWTAWGDDF